LSLRDFWNGSKISDESLDRHARLANQGLQSFWVDRIVIGNGDADLSFGHPNVRAFLFLYLETEPSESLDRLGS